MSTLAISENRDNTKKLDLWTMWGLISIVYSEKVNGEYIIRWHRRYKTIEGAGRWFRKYEETLLDLKTPEEKHPGIKICVSADGEISLMEA